MRNYYTGLIQTPVQSWRAHNRFLSVWVACSSSFSEYHSDILFFMFEQDTVLWCYQQVYEHTCLECFQRCDLTQSVWHHFYLPVKQRQWQAMKWSGYKETQSFGLSFHFTLEDPWSYPIPYLSDDKWQNSGLQLAQWFPDI